MTKVTDLPEIDALADTDYFYVVDASDPSNPDKKVPRVKMRPAGSIISTYFRYAANITIPAIAAATEQETTISVPGAAVGDHVLFNMQDALPANLGVTMVRVSAADTVQVRFRNLHTANAYAGAALLCVALVIRSIVP
ncbi:hypothetical protein HFO65_15975 [Rhizobium laguerreae]|uniref:hypothetical protein n=1 Tax=Rhizobium laguerreae TaxID=1076926 RepID=UPI001C9006AB|nr:hypothetical protein [Rhizobium laguerreae]MBY3162129.1 hypothetical protein [Rhizobium laguerreae]